MRIVALHRVRVPAALGRVDARHLEARVVEGVLAPLLGAQPDQRRPRRAPALELVDRRAHEHEPPADRHGVHDRLEVASRGGGLEALDPVPPVGHPEVRDRPPQRRVAQPVRQVVVEHRDLLGLGRDDDVAGCEARRDRLGDVAHVALLVGYGTDRPQHDHEQEADQAEAARVREPGGRQEQQRRQRDRQVAVRPGRRDLRRRPRDQHRAEEERDQRRHHAPSGRQGAQAPAGAEQRGDARAAREEQRDQRRAPGQAVGHAGEHRELRGARPRGARVGGLVERRRQPGQVEQRDGAEREQAVTQQPPAPHGRCQPHEPQPGEPGRRPEEQRPVVRVEQRRERGDEARRPPARGRLAGLRERERPHERRAGDEAQQHHQRVHARLLRVLREERVGRGQPGGHPGAPLGDDRPARPPGDRDGDERAQQRQRAGGLLRAPGEREPEVQQQVVQRWGAVEAQGRQDVGERPVGDARRRCPRRSSSRCRRPGCAAAASRRSAGRARARPRRASPRTRAAAPVAPVPPT